MCKKLVIACLLLSFITYAKADWTMHPDTEDAVIGNWENAGDMDGWVVGAGNIATPGVYSYGATLGFYSLKLQSPNSWWNEAMYIDLGTIEGGKDAFFGNNTFSIDVSWLSSEWVDAGTGWYASPSISLLINPDKGWYQGNWWNGGSPGSLDVSTDGTTTLSWNYQNITQGYIDSSSTSIKIILVINYSQFVEPTALYFDNARLTGNEYIEMTPEPTTIALLGLGGLAMLRGKK